MAAPVKLIHAYERHTVPVTLIDAYERHAVAPIIVPIAEHQLNLTCIYIRSSFSGQVLYQKKN